jgi:hypothetical protein
MSILLLFVGIRLVSRCRSLAMGLRVVKNLGKLEQHPV